MYRIIALCLILSGCASDPQIVAVQTKLPSAPASCTAKVPAAPKLPERSIGVGEFASRYARLQASYQEIRRRSLACQKFVAKL